MNLFNPFVRNSYLLKLLFNSFIFCIGILKFNHLLAASYISKKSISLPMR